MEFKIDEIVVSNVEIDSTTLDIPTINELFNANI